jgi:hypothetical protein
VSALAISVAGSEIESRNSETANQRRFIFTGQFLSKVGFPRDNLLLVALLNRLLR